MTDETLISVWLNPLLMISKDHANGQEKYDIESIMKFICSPNVESSTDSIIERYNKISLTDKQLFAPPAEVDILNKLIYPLRNAKVSFILGNYLGTIALCGMVSEMSCLLLYHMLEFKINNKKMSTDDEKNLFGSSFEKLGQDRRVEILKVYNLIDSDTYEAFKLIRLTRRKYLHLWSKEHNTIEDDSIKIFNAILLIVIKLIGQDIKDGKIYLNPKLLSYLKRKGFYSK